MVKRNESRQWNNPEMAFRFPEAMSGNSKQSYQHERFKNYPWLDYDVTSDSITCHIWKHLNSLDNLKAERLKEDTFLDKGSDNWKKGPLKFIVEEWQLC